MPNPSENIILTKTIDFALEIIKYAELLEEQRKYVIARQLLRAGTGIAANVHDTQNAENKVDFVHKFKIAAKEMTEGRYWLILCDKAASYPPCDHLSDSLFEIEKDYK